jgi:hypothetical protein
MTFAQKSVVGDSSVRQNPFLGEVPEHVEDDFGDNYDATLAAANGAQATPLTSAGGGGGGLASSPGRSSLGSIGEHGAGGGQGVRASSTASFLGRASKALRAGRRSISESLEGALARESTWQEWGGDHGAPTIFEELLQEARDHDSAIPGGNNSHVKHEMDAI